MQAASPAQRGNPRARCAVPASGSRCPAKAAACHVRALTLCDFSITRYLMVGPVCCLGAAGTATSLLGQATCAPAPPGRYSNVPGLLRVRSRCLLFCCQLNFSVSRGWIALLGSIPAGTGLFSASRARSDATRLALDPPTGRLHASASSTDIRLFGRVQHTVSPGQLFQH